MTDSEIRKKLIRMKQVLFIQGAGAGAYQEDGLLANNLQQLLGTRYEVHYPKMPDEANAPYAQWKQLIEKEVAVMNEPIILVGHSIGASHLIKCLTEIKLTKQCAGIFLLETPFWGGDGWRYEGYELLELPNDSAAKFPKDARIFLYHCHEDEIVHFDHLALYGKLLPQATVREIDKGNHQLNNDLSIIAQDIQRL